MITQQPKQRQHFKGQHVQQSVSMVADKCECLRLGELWREGQDMSSVGILLDQARGVDRLGQHRGQQRWHEAATIRPNAVLEARTEPQLLERGMCHWGRGLLPVVPAGGEEYALRQSVAQRAFVTVIHQSHNAKSGLVGFCVFVLPLCTVRLGGTGPPQPANRPRGV